MSVSPGEQNCSQYREAAGLFESYCIDGARIDLTDRFPLIVAALAKLRSRSCIIDGEAVACGVMAFPPLIGSGAGAMPMCSSMPSA